MVSTTWSYDQRAGRNDGAKKNVLEKVQQSLKNGERVIGLHTLGSLSGIAATKSLYAQLRAGKAIINLRLGEGSVLEVGELSQSEAQSLKIPNSSLELLSAQWMPQGEGDSVNGTAEYFQLLKPGPVEMSTKSFPTMPHGRFKTLDVT